VLQTISQSLEDLNTTATSLEGTKAELEDTNSRIAIDLVETQKTLRSELEALHEQHRSSMQRDLSAAHNEALRQGLEDVSEKLAAKLALQAQESQHAMIAAVREVSRAEQRRLQQQWQQQQQHRPNGQDANSANQGSAASASRSSSFAGITVSTGTVNSAPQSPRINEEKPQVLVLPTEDSVYEAACIKLAALQKKSNEEYRQALQGELEEFYKRQSSQFREDMQGLYTMMAGAIASQTQMQEVRLAVEAITEQQRNATSALAGSTPRVPGPGQPGPTDPSSVVSDSEDAAGRKAVVHQALRMFSRGKSHN